MDQIARFHTVFPFVLCFLLRGRMGFGYIFLTNPNILYMINCVRLRGYRALLSIECFPIVNADPVPRSV